MFPIPTLTPGRLYDKIIAVEIFPGKKIPTDFLTGKYPANSGKINRKSFRNYPEK